MPLDRRDLLFCDLTQSWSDRGGGGISTYLRAKRAHIRDHTPWRHLLIVPGACDEVIREGRLTTVTIRSPRVPGSPHYRLLVRNKAVDEALAGLRPDLVECLDAYNLPWAALHYRSRRPEAVLVAGYRTDFPSAYLRRVGRRFIGDAAARVAERLGYRYASWIYRRFDAVYALSEHGGAARLRAAGVPNVRVLPLGVDLDLFHPARRSEALRAELGMAPDQPLLIYAGRVDREKRGMTVFEAFRRLPDSLGARLLMIGDGKLRVAIGEAGRGLRVHLPGFIRDRRRLAALLASSDIYVSGMADETFGISIIEAQACGLPVVGVAAGAMLDRVPPDLGRLGPVDDAGAMAANILSVWREGAAAIGRRGRDHVAARFSWPRTFERLFGDIYPRAAARRDRAIRAARSGRAGGRAAATGRS